MVINALFNNKLIIPPWPRGKQLLARKKEKFKRGSRKIGSESKTHKWKIKVLQSKGNILR